MRTRFALLSILITVVATFSLAAYEVDLPDPPSGYSWKKIEKIKAAFLVPDDWHFKEHKQGKTLGYFITREDIDKEGFFETGLTINVIRNQESKDAVQYAREFIAAVAEKHEVIEQPFSSEAGVMKGYGCKVRDVSSGEPPLIMHYLVIGNASTNTVYILFFESPEPGWEEAWAIGERILQMFLVDDEI